MAASFRCYDNSDVIAFLIMTNFHLYLIKLWWQFFQMFVCGDVVMLRIGRYWPWKTFTVSSHLHIPVRPMLLHRMTLVSFRLYFLVRLKYPNLTSLKVIFKIGNRFHQVNDSKVPYMLINRHSQSQKTSQILIWVKRGSGVSCERPQRYQAILLEPASTEVRKKIKGSKRSNKSCVFVEEEPIIV